MLDLDDERVVDLDLGAAAWAPRDLDRPPVYDKVKIFVRNVSPTAPTGLGDVFGVTRIAGPVVAAVDVARRPTINAAKVTNKAATTSTKLRRMSVPPPVREG